MELTEKEQNIFVLEECKKLDIDILCKIVYNITIERFFYNLIPCIH